MRKATKYAALGLADYWIVDPRDHEVTTFRLEDGAYVSTGAFGSGTGELTYADHPVTAVIDALLG